MVSVNIRRFFGNVLDWIYPPVCVSCGKPGALICEECLSKLPAVGDHYCSVCGKPLKKNHSCRLCNRSGFRFGAARAPYLYDGPVSAMIKKLKFGGMMGLAPILSGLLTEYWKSLDWETDLIVPVPLSVGVPCKPGALMKQRETKQQVGLNAEERRINLSGSFAAEKSFIKDKRILLLDDVMTTGSTFSECSAVLLDTGAKSVRCLSVATTSEDHGKQKMSDAL